MSDLSIPLNGFERAASQIDFTASKIARGSLPSSSSPTNTSSIEDTVDLSADTVALLQNRLVAESNLKAFQSVDGLQKSLFSAFG